MSTEDAITQAELAEALKRRSYLDDPCAYARDVFADIAAHREPEYEPGAVYLDGCGLPLRYTVSGGWEAFGHVGEHTHDFPLRPLRKLVPEPALTGEPLVWAITEELDDQTGLARSDCIDIARRICKLIEGGSDGS